MTVPAKITIVTLGVADLERACAFYDRLGWRRSSESNEWIVWFATTGTVLGLTSFESLAEDAGVPAEPRGGVLRRHARDQRRARRPRPADARRGGRLPAGASSKPAGQADWGGVTGYFADPDGYPWEVVWSPAFPRTSVACSRCPSPRNRVVSTGC